MDIIQEFVDELDALVIETEGLMVEISPHLKIDKYNLEDVVAEHSEYYYRIAQVQSRTNGFFHRAQLLVKEIKADIAGKIRENPEDYGIIKLTEGQVVEATDREVKASESRAIRQQAEELNQSATALVNAFEHRRSMINNEVQLMLSGLSSAESDGKRETMKEAVKTKTRRRRVEREKED